MSAHTEEHTFGAEDEYQIVDPETHELRARGGRVVRRAWQDLSEEEVGPELLSSQIEVMTPLCRKLAEARAELSRLRREVAEAAAKKAAGSRPRVRTRSRTGKSSRSHPRSATRGSWRATSDRPGNS